MRRRQQCGLIFLAWVLGNGGMAVSAEGIFPDQALADRELAALRGGFLVDNLEISIGLEQVVSVNGEMLAINRLTIPNLNQMVSGQALPHKLETVLGVVGPGQNGSALVAASAAEGGWLTVIQNNLNSTVIQNAQQLNIELNNLGAGYRIPDSMREPILQFLGR